MKNNKVLIGGRYQYTPADCLRDNQIYSQYRAYDKVTKRDLILQKHNEDNTYISKLRQVKHAFIHLVFDVIKLEEDNKVAVFFQPGVQANLEQVLHKNHYITENDALVIFKYALLALKQLHQKMITYQKMCPQNILFCTHSIIKLGSFAYPSQVPLETKSPEALRQQRLNYASDVYSLGTILYKMLFGCYPFQGSNQADILDQIKSKKFRQLQTASPFKIVATKQIRVLLGQMLDYLPENRPSLQAILKHSLLSFPVETDLQAYVKPKGNIIPEPFIRKYLVFRASKVIYRYDDYYQQSCYLALSIKDKQFVSLYAPDVKMFETQPRKIQSYFEKLRGIKESYMPETCGFLCKIDDYERFRREPVLMLQYCNQGDLYHYLQKRKKQLGWLTQKQIHIAMYLLALSFKQMKDLGLTSIHTVHSQRIMIKNKNIKIRQPGLLTPFLQNKLMMSHKIDYFAPQLKQKSDFVELDKSDMWSYGVLYYYLLRGGALPELNTETKSINIQILQTNKKNKNLIGKCLDQNVSRRLTLQQIKIQGVNENLLEQMLEQKRKQDEADQQDEQSNEQVGQNYKKGNHVIFKSRKKKWCKNYNKIIALSSTSSCRIGTRILFGLIILWIVFFGLFILNGGVGMLRTNYYRKITLQVPFNYATSLYNMTILSMNGTKFENQYKDYSYQQFTIDLNCTQNNHSLTATGQVYSYINYGHSVHCFFGFVFLILFSVAYGIIQFKLDLPRLLVQRKKSGDNMGIVHHIIMNFILCALLFCFFTIFAFEYMIQMTPCLGLQNQAYPNFTSVETLLNGNVGQFMACIFPTVILWSILMFLYIFLGLLHKKINKRILQYKFVIPAIGLIIIYTVICRIGFGKSVPIQPSWSYKINRDVVSQYWGLFGLFPQILMIPIICLDRIVDFLFWFFLRMGMEPQQQQDIRQVEFNAKLQPITDQKQLQTSNAKLNMMNDFEIFD